MSVTELIFRKRHLLYVTFFSVSAWFLIAMLVGGFIPIYGPAPGGWCNCCEHDNVANYSFLVFGFGGIITGFVFAYPLHRFMLVKYSKPEDEKVPLIWMARWGSSGCSWWIVVFLISVAGYITGDIITHTYIRKHPNEKYLLIHAVTVGDIELVKKALESGADVNLKSLTGATPLHIAAARQRRLDIAVLLIENGANINAMQFGRNTPLDQAWAEEMKALIRAHGGKTGEELKAEKEK